MLPCESCARRPEQLSSLKGLGIIQTADPGLKAWAKFCRAYGALLIPEVFGWRSFASRIASTSARSCGLPVASFAQPEYESFMAPPLFLDHTAGSPIGLV